MRDHRAEVFRTGLGTETKKMYCAPLTGLSVYMQKYHIRVVNISVGQPPVKTEKKRAQPDTGSGEIMGSGAGGRGSGRKSGTAAREHYSAGKQQKDHYRRFQ